MAAERDTLWVAPRRDVVFVAGLGMAIAPLVKRPGETRVYSMQFGFAPELSAGKMLVGTPTVTGTAQELISGSTPLSIAAPLIAGTTVQVSIAGGTNLEDYLVTFTAPLSGGGTISEAGILQVRAQ